ncbi:MAG: Carbohydrate kinase, partial [Acidimicrobiaceae bacterium]
GAAYGLHGTVHAHAVRPRHHRLRKRQLDHRARPRRLVDRDGRGVGLRWHLSEPWLHPDEDAGAHGRHRDGHRACRKVRRRRKARRHPLARHPVPRVRPDRPDRRRGRALPHPRMPQRHGARRARPVHRSSTTRGDLARRLDAGDGRPAGGRRRRRPTDDPRRSRSGRGGLLHQRRHHARRRRAGSSDRARRRVHRLRARPRLRVVRGAGHDRAARVDAAAGRGRRRLGGDHRVVRQAIRSQVRRSGDAGRATR